MNNVDAPAFRLGKTVGGSRLHVFGQQGESLCQAGELDGETKDGKLCQNCKHFASMMGILPGNGLGGEA